MIIKGANLETREAEFNKLSKYEWNMNLNQVKLIKYIEDIYSTISNKKNDFQIKNILIDDNKVVIEPGMINHRCSSDIDTIRFISKYGVLASEWFGILESEGEARFCTFVSRMKSQNYPYKGDLAEDNYSRLNVGDNIILFFDESNPIMEYLLHLDFFEYENNKNKGANLSEIYNSSEIDLFANLIEPLSPGGKNMRKNYEFKTNYWSAVPGGIPSFLINGICIKNNKFTQNEVDEISSLFPNAVIFNGNLDVIHYPYYCDNNVKLSK